MRYAWMDDAACIGSDPEAWFPEKGHAVKIQKRICNECPVRDACLDFAMANDLNAGIYGGLSPRQRQARARELREAA